MSGHCLRTSQHNYFCFSSCFKRLCLSLIVVSLLLCPYVLVFITVSLCAGVYYCVPMCWCLKWVGVDNSVPPHSASPHTAVRHGLADQKSTLLVTPAQSMHSNTSTKVCQGANEAIQAYIVSEQHVGLAHVWCRVQTRDVTFQRLRR
jgi:hypothetical protein